MSDLEDGEVPTSEEEEEMAATPRVPRAPANSLEFPEFPDEFDYNIPERPKAFLPRTAAASSSSVLSAPVPPPAVLMPGASAGVFGNVELSGLGNPVQAQSPSDPTLPAGDHDMYDGSRRAYYKDLGVSDLLESSGDDKSDYSDSDSSDSDCGNPFEKSSRKRSRMRVAPAPPINNNAAPAGDYATLFSSKPNASSSATATSSSSASGDLSAFQAFASTFQKQRKPNNIWSNVMQEEQISDVFGGVKVEERSLTNIEVERGPETYSYYRPIRPPRQRRASDSTDISSEGLSDNALHYLRGGFKDEDEEEETGAPSEHDLPKSFTCKNAFRKTTSSNKRRRTQPKLKRKVINKLKKMKAPDLAEYMASKLYEEKVNLLEKAINTIGKDMCIKLFIKTLKIEKRGGVMVKNHDRRRTPGGVFLYLLRGDRRVPKSQVDLIFKDERAFHDKFRKKKAAVGRLGRKAKLEAEKEKIELSASADAMGDDPVVHWQDQERTDTGHLGDEEESGVHEVTTEECGSSEMQCDG